MEVSNASVPSSNPAFVDHQNPPIYNSMDMDMDIDLGNNFSNDLDPFEDEGMNIDLGSARNLQQIQDNGTLEPQDLDSQDMAWDKVHVRGLDNLTTENLQTFALEHSAMDIVRCEWINDTSANLVYETPEMASQALDSLTESPDSWYESPLQLRKAKRLSSHPDVDLSIRIATTADVKAPRAHEASRFYLMNPDKDPRERRRQQDSRHSRRGRNGDRRNQRDREDEEHVPFDVNMYDDDPVSLAARDRATRPRRDSRSGYASDDSRRMRRGRFGNSRSEDLFEDKMRGNTGGKLRNRSASPLRNDDGDGRLGFDEGDENTTDRGRRMRQRDRTPPASRLRGNAGKELFNFKSDSAGAGKEKTDVGKDLFSDKLAKQAVPSTRELFPRKSAASHHRRTVAFDAADGTGDLFADRLQASKLDMMSEPAQPRDLADRVSGGLRGSTTIREDGGDQLEGFSIRGSAQEGNGGFSIRGSARASGYSNRVKELFPEKGEKNTGKDLFSRIKSAPRKRAEDMF